MTHENYRQKSLFESDHHQSEIDWEYVEPFIDEYAPKNDDAQQQRDAELIERADSEPDLLHNIPAEIVGPSIPLGQHFLNSQQMMAEVLGANKGRYFVMKNTTPQGFDATVQQYGSVSTAIGVSMNTGRRAARLQSRMDKLFLAEELITAGFAAKAVREASKKLTAELTAKYTGTHNESDRGKKRRQIARNLKAVNKRIAADE